MVLPSIPSSRNDFLFVALATVSQETPYCAEIDEIENLDSETKLAISNLS